MRVKFSRFFRDDGESLLRALFASMIHHFQLRLHTKVFLSFVSRLKVISLSSFSVDRDWSSEEIFVVDYTWYYSIIIISIDVLI